jgi:hypothetical protein
LYIAIILVVLGFGLRLVDLTDPPVDFHPTRQFRGAVIARSIYYDLDPVADPELADRAAALRSGFEEFEPPILETAAALGYLALGREALWIPRVIVSLVWCLGGLALFALVRESVSGLAGLAALSYYLFLPFGVIASRSFQPDPLMTVAIILTIWTAYRWAERQTWGLALAAGLLAALAVLVKVVAAYFLAGVMIAGVLHTFGFRRAVRNLQVWVVAGMMTLIPVAYYLLVIGESSSNYFQNWVVALLPLLLTADFYLGWVKRLAQFDLLPMLAAAAGFVLLARGRGRWMLWGAWIGYALYGFSLPLQTATHSYYHLPITPLVAWSLAYTVKWGLDRIGEQRPRWQLAAAAVLVIALALPARQAVQTLLAEDHRAEQPYWEYVGEHVPRDGETIGLVQHYGHLLLYYGWSDVALWPVSAELALAELRDGGFSPEFETMFRKRTEGMDYFLVTNFGDFERQTALNQYLYDQFPVHFEGQKVLVFDLDPSDSN